MFFNNRWSVVAFVFVQIFVSSMYVFEGIPTISMAWVGCEDGHLIAIVTYGRQIISQFVVAYPAEFPFFSYMEKRRMHSSGMSQTDSVQINFFYAKFNYSNKYKYLLLHESYEIE